MTEKPSLDQLFQSMHDQVACELGIARAALTHTGTMGTVSENRWIKMLREYLPKRYKVNRAFVIDSKGGCSDQIDIVVHDRQYSPFVLSHDDALYVPAESVYAVLEVKQTLNAEHVNYAGTKISSVRTLHMTSIPIKHAGGEYPAKPPHRIWGGLVALDSDWNPPFGEPLRNAISVLSPDEQLDIGCAVRHGVFEVTYSMHEPPSIATEGSTASLALFLLRFIARLQMIATVPCIDVLAYAAKVSDAGTP